MADFKFKLNGAGVRELLQSGEMQSILSEYAASTASRAGDGYASSVHMGQKRAYANVYPDTHDAYTENLENNTLLKALGG